FGHGLSYTRFDYGAASATPYDEGVTVSVEVTNAGDRAGQEVVQVYVAAIDSSVQRPAQDLRAFAKVDLAPGQRQRLAFRLGWRAFAVWDVGAGHWTVPGGEYEIRIGASSRDVRARLTVALTPRRAD
ncbi:MAG: fibronectin type III-like domain-contianing protein, partial [Pseudomonadales bacterium]